MRVLFWSESFWPYIGGAELSGAQLITALSRRGYEFVVVTSHWHTNLPDQERYKGTPVYRLPFRAALAAADLDQLAAIWQQVARLKRAFAPDLIHLNSLDPTVFFHLRTQAAHPAPVLITLRREIPAVKTGRRGLLTPQLLRSAHWVTGVSAAVLDQARQLAPEITAHSSVIYNAQEVPPLPPTPLPIEPPRLLCVGRLAAEKGFDVALTAFATVVRRFPHVRLLIAGDGAERTALEQQATRLGVRQALDFLGWVAPAAIPSLLNTVSLVLMPSRKEAFPRVALETALMARPVVATRAGGLPEVVVHRQTGLLVEKEDSKGLAEAVTFLLEHPETATQMGHAARQRATATFSLGRCVDAYETLYQHLTRKDPPTDRTPSTPGPRAKTTGRGAAAEKR